MEPENKKIWNAWKLMHYHSVTLMSQLESLSYHSPLSFSIQNELNELNRQMAEMEDANEWLPKEIANEFG
jgi:hypothetical protein